SSQPVFGLIVHGTLGAFTVRRTVYANVVIVRLHDVRDPLQALQFVLFDCASRSGPLLSIRGAARSYNVKQLESKPRSKLVQ
ncbi:hypothetical protein P692DRAFT_20740177, partial [Suillus brevipes Sb2]